MGINDPFLSLLMQINEVFQICFWLMMMFASAFACVHYYLKIKKILKFDDRLSKAESRVDALVKDVDKLGMSVQVVNKQTYGIGSDVHAKVIPIRQPSIAGTVLNRIRMGHYVILRVLYLGNGKPSVVSIVDPQADLHKEIGGPEGMAIWNEIIQANDISMRRMTFTSQADADLVAFNFHPTYKPPSTYFTSPPAPKAG